MSNSDMKGVNIMSIPVHENKFVKNCLNCNLEITDLNEEHLFCTQCGFPIRNECTGTQKFNSGYGNEQIFHDTETEEIYILNPSDVYCPKCGAISLFAEKNLIDVKYPKVDVIDPTSNDNDPF